MNPTNNSEPDTDLPEFGPPLDVTPSAAPPQAKSEPPLGCLDGINGRIVGGWAFDPDRPSERLTVCIYEGARELGRTIASLLREDLQKRGKGDGWHAFRFWLPPELFDGETYLISARVAGSDAELPGSPKTLTAHALPRPASEDARPPGPAGLAEEQAARFASDVRPDDKLLALGPPSELVSLSASLQVKPGRALGWLDGINGRIVGGWAFDPDRPSERLTVCIYDGERELGRTTASLLREDLQKSAKGDGWHGFRFSLPLELFERGTHQISARLEGAAVELDGSPKTLMTQASSSPEDDPRSSGLALPSSLILLGAPPRAESGSALGCHSETLVRHSAEGANASKISGCIDGLEGSYVTGWALAEADDNSCSIKITDGTGNIVGGGRAAHHRADLAALRRGRRNFAFRMPVQTLGVTGPLHVFADEVELPGSPVPIGAGYFDGSLSVTSEVIEGWVTERMQTFEAPRVRIATQDGETVAEVQSVLAIDAADPLFAPARFSVPVNQRCFGWPELVLRALANGSEFARANIKLRLKGFLDCCSLRRCAGWLLSPDAPQRDFEIEIFCDGKLVGSGRCDLPRDDLRELYPSSWRAGFDIALTAPVTQRARLSRLSVRLADTEVELFDGPFIIGDRSSTVSAAATAARLSHSSDLGLTVPERSVLQAALAQFIDTARRGDDRVVLRHPGRPMPSTDGLRLTVIIPIYRNVNITRTCIRSVLAHRRPESNGVILVNDCSPDPGMAEMLAEFRQRPGVFLLENGTNVGFVQSVNRALEFCLHSDVVLLNSDTQVFEGAFDELWHVAYGSPDIGTVTAISNNATIFSYPHPEQPASKLKDASWEELAAVALRENAGIVVDVPTGHGFCMLVRREVLARVGHFNEIFGRGYGEENDLCMRAADVGYRNVAAAGVLVEHCEGTSFGEQKQELLRTNLRELANMYPDYMSRIMEYQRADNIRKARWALDAFRLRKVSQSGRSFVLVIDNWLDGGTKRAISDTEYAVGYGSADKLHLSCRSDGFLQLDSAGLELRAVFAADEDGPLFEMLSVARIDLVLIHQLIGYSIGFIRRLCLWTGGRRAIYFAHDFYPLCPRVTMIDAAGQLCGLPETGVCARCVALGGAHEASRLEELNPESHRALFSALLHSARHVVAPSHDTAAHYNAIFPDLGVKVLPHAGPPRSVRRTARNGSYDHVALLGALGTHKGSAMLLKIAHRACLDYPRMRFHVIGYTDIDRQLLALGNVTVSGPYKAAELGPLVARITAKLALFLHQWPETYSYTLTEAVELGLVPLVPDIGAPAERVRAARFGLVFPFPIEAGKVLRIISEISEGSLQPWGDGATPASFGLAADSIAEAAALLHHGPLSIAASE